MPLRFISPPTFTVKDVQNLTDWKNAFFDRPVPYLTDKGFPNPPCLPRDAALHSATQIRSGLSVSRDKWPPVKLSHNTAGTYVIGDSDDCMKENNTDHFCNGPLKSNTVYV